ncbi:uncharacterized protein PAE49_009412 [Odontesthes bonariensis]
MVLRNDQWILLEELEQVLKPFEQATVFLSGESYVTISVLPPLLKGFHKSTKKTTYKSASVNSFQIAADQEMKARWESESAFEENGQNVAIIAAALDPRFRRMKFLSPENALKVQVQIQALIIYIKRAKQQLETIEQEHSPSPQQKNTSLLDILLGSDSEGEGSTEDIGQEDSVVNLSSQYDKQAATAAAQTFLSVLNRTIEEPRQRSQDMPTPSTVQNEMSRSFPGFFKRKSADKHRDKKHKPWKGFDMAFFLLSDKAETTPTTQDELELLQAGLGKRTLSITKDLSHEELSTLLESTYPKMASLEGGWLLYKAAGGHGRRRMTAVALESEGYTGSVLRSASAGGKFMLYIAPLQEKIDLTPLPVDAPEFSLMPKATCTQCKMVMPLQMLALHVQGDCEGTSSTALCDSEQEDEELDSSVPATLDVPPSNKQSKTKCPICNKYFPSQDIEFHASICGTSCSPVWSPDAGPESPHDLQEPTQDPIDDISCEEGVLRWVDSKVETGKTFNICVSRDNMLERGLKLWQRQKTGGPANKLKITFIGEAGIDTGALRKEFLSEMVAGIETRLFEGGKKGKIPKYSITDLDKNYFKVAGEIFAVSLGQGGPPPSFLQEWCYQYLVTGTLKDITKENVHDAELSTLIEMIENATDVTQYTEEILNCGYTGPITLEHKDSIVRAVLLHATTKRTPMLQQLQEGLEL